MAQREIQAEQTITKWTRKPQDSHNQDFSNQDDTNQPTTQLQRLKSFMRASARDIQKNFNRYYGQNDKNFKR